MQAFSGAGKERQESAEERTLFLSLPRWTDWKQKTARKRKTGRDSKVFSSVGARFSIHSQLFFFFFPSVSVLVYEELDVQLKISVYPFIYLTLSPSVLAYLSLLRKLIPLDALPLSSRRLRFLFSFF